MAFGSGLSYTQKISLAAGSLSALYLLPAQAGIVHVSGSPVSLAFSSAIGTTANWDVDGLNGPDFQLLKFPFLAGAILLNSLAYPGSTTLNGRGVVALSNSGQGALFMRPLQKSFDVGPTLTTYAWGTPNPPIHFAMAKSTGGYYTAFPFLPAGDSYIGFRFLSGANLLYGWADINIDATPGSGGVTIKEWAYNDTADTPIHIADVPEPSTPALTLLGLGAAGLRAWRARKKAPEKLAA